jgi:hypothetical protein
MRLSPTLIAIVLAASILSLQLSGLHLHVNSDGDGDGGLHGTHVHDADHDGHGHEADTDVSLIKLFSGWVKLLFILAPFVCVMLAVMRLDKPKWAPITRRILSRGQSRWRPPLRAPPIPVS